jgi:hypothetical protein
MYARHDLDPIGFLPLGDMTRGTRAPAVKIALNIGLGERKPGRAAINHTSNGRAMRLTEIGDPEQLTKSVSRHRGLT